MPQEIKGNVRPPMAMPDEALALRERSSAQRQRSQMPLLIRLFAWYCFLRAAIALIFGLMMGLAPGSDTAAFVAGHFDPFSRELSPEALFYILAILYTAIGWRWISGDWRARWGAMFMSGATAARALIGMLANHFAGDPIPMTAEQRQAVSLGILINVLVCMFLAFYPGMEQSFRETP